MLEKDIIFKQQSKITFNRTQKSDTLNDFSCFKKKEIRLDKPIYVGFAILKLSKLLMYDTYYDKLQPYFGQENIQLCYMDTGSFVISKTNNIFSKI